MANLWRMANSVKFSCLSYVNVKCQKLSYFQFYQRIFNGRLSRKQVVMVIPQQLAHCTRNSLKYPFSSQLMKTTQLDSIAVIGGNVETSKQHHEMHSSYFAKGRTRL